MNKDFCILGGKKRRRRRKKAINDEKFLLFWRALIERMDGSFPFHYAAFLFNHSFFFVWPGNRFLSRTAEQKLVSNSRHGRMRMIESINGIKDGGDRSINQFSFST